LIFLPSPRPSQDDRLERCRARRDQGLREDGGLQPIRDARDKKTRRAADLKEPWDAVARYANLRCSDCTICGTPSIDRAGSSLGLPIVGKLLVIRSHRTTARYAHLDADPLRRATNIIAEKLAAADGVPAPRGRVPPTT